jgi:LuxR family maltose regulon positive regulatory protein
LYQQAAVGHYQHDMIEILILQALALDYGGDRPAARQALQEALDLAEPGSLVRTFVDSGLHLAPILAQLEGPYALRLYQALVEEPRVEESEPSAAEILNLTPREQQVLKEIGAGLSNKEIEEKLVISHNTVRTHIKNLYSKLDVTSRTQAIRKARELDLL